MNIKINPIWGMAVFLIGTAALSIFWLFEELSRDGFLPYLAIIVLCYALVVGISVFTCLKGHLKLGVAILLVFTGLDIFGSRLGTQARDWWLFESYKEVEIDITSVDVNVYSVQGPTTDSTSRKAPQKVDKIAVTMTGKPVDAANGGGLVLLLSEGPSNRALEHGYYRDYRTAESDFADARLTVLLTDKMQDGLPVCMPWRSKTKDFFWSFVFRVLFPLTGAIAAIGIFFFMTKVDKAQSH